MITSLFIQNVVPACVINTLTACKNRASEAFHSDAFQRVWQFRKGTLIQSAANEVKESLKGVAVQAVGMNLGTYFPQEAIAARMILGVGQLAYERFRKPPEAEDVAELDGDDVFFDDLNEDGPSISDGMGAVVSDIAAEIKGQVAGLTAATVTTLVLSYFYFTGAPMASSPAPLQYLLTLMGTASGGFVALWMANKDPTDHQSPWYDNYINRNMRYIAGQNAVQAISHVIPSVTTVATVAGNVLPALLGSMVIFTAKITDTVLSLVFQNVAAYSAYYAMPLSKVVYNAIYFKPTPSDYANLDPNLLIKSVIHSLHGNPAALTHELMADNPLATSLKKLIAELVNQGVAQDCIVNLIVRSINEYAALIQDGYIKVATKELSEAVSADEQLKNKAELKKWFDALPANNIQQTIKELKQYHERLTTDSAFKMKFANIVSQNDPQTQQTELEKLLPGNSCNLFILKLYRANSSSAVVCEIIQHLLIRLNVTAKKDQLNRHLHSKIMNVAIDQLPDNLSPPPYVQSMIEEALSEVEKQEEILLGKTISDKAQTQLRIEAHAQALMTLILKNSDQMLIKKKNPPLTESEIRQFYLNLNHCAFAPLPYAIPQGIGKLLDIAIWLGVTYGEPAPRIINSLLIENADQIRIEEINDDEFGLTSSVHQEVATPTVTPQEIPDELTEGLISPAKLTDIAINNMYGNPLALAEAIVQTPIFQSIINRLIARTIDSKVLVNTLVRSINQFATILTDPEIKTAMLELSHAPTAAAKEVKKKTLNHMIYAKIFDSFTMSCLETWVAYGTKSAVGKRLKPIIQEIILALKEKKIDLVIAPFLNKDYDETTLEVCLRGFIIMSVLKIKKGLTYQRKNRPLESAEIEAFYSNLVNLTFSPFSHPVTDMLKQVSKTGLPLLLDKAIPHIPRILTIFNEVSIQAIEEINEAEFEGDTPLPPTDKPFDPIRKIQKTWYKFVATLYYIVDNIQRSIHDFGKSFSPVTPVKTAEPLPPKAKTNGPKVVHRASRKTPDRYSVHPTGPQDPTAKPPQTWKMASPRRTSRRQRNTPPVC